MYIIIVIIILVIYVLIVIHKRKSITAIASACTDTSDIKEICDKYSIDLIIYDKCGECKNAPPNTKCITRKNVGREQETFLAFVIDNYDNLPDELLFIALPLHKHYRKERMIHMIENNIVGCHHSSVKDHGDFIIDVYENNKQHPAPLRPFKAWFDKFVEPWNNSLKGGICWNGIMKTTKERILKKPKYFYETILNQLSTHNSHEVGHFMERSMGSVF